MSSFAANLHYGVSLKNLFPSVTNDDIEEIALNIRECILKVKEKLDSLYFKSVLDYKFITSLVDDEATSDIIFFLKNNIEIHEKDNVKVKVLSIDNEIELAKEQSSAFAYECLLLLTILGFDMEYEVYPQWILSLSEN
jgi:hypothetical protein